MNVSLKSTNATLAIQQQQEKKKKKEKQLAIKIYWDDIK